MLLSGNHAGYVHSGGGGDHGFLGDHRALLAGISDHDGGFYGGSHGGVRSGDPDCSEARQRSGIPAREERALSGERVLVCERKVLTEGKASRRNRGIRVICIGQRGVEEHCPIGMWLGKGGKRHGRSDENIGLLRSSTVAGDIFSGNLGEEKTEMEISEPVTAVHPAYRGVSACLRRGL